MLIGISGKSGSGKSTTMADYLQVRYGFRIEQFSKPLLFAVNMITPPQKKPYKEEYRRLLQEVGSAFRRYNPNCLLQCRRRYDGKNVVFDDVRFRNEAAWVKENGGILWRINVSPRESAIEHESETDLDDFAVWDAVYHREEDTPIETAHRWVDGILETHTSKKG